MICGMPGCSRPAMFRLTLEVLDPPTPPTVYLACDECLLGWLEGAGQTLEDAARVGNAAVWAATIDSEAPG